MIKKLSIRAKHGNPNIDKIKKFLKKQRKIRLFSDSTPGSGNQASTQGLDLRLRKDFEYPGEIELIYPNSTLSKITNLYDLPANLTNPYYDPFNQITFRTVGNYAISLLNNSIEHVSLGMSGGNDFGYWNALDEEGFDRNKLTRQQLFNDASFFESEVFVDFTAFYEMPNSIYTYNGNRTFQDESYRTFLWSPYATFNDTKRYLANDPRGQALLQSKPALKTYIQGLEDQAFYNLPMYGFTIQQDERMFPWNVLQIICSARLSLLYELTKPLVIPVFYDYTQELKILDELINQGNWSILDSSWRARDAVHDYILDLDLPKHFKTIDMSDESAVESLQNLKNDDVAMLSMGPTPRQFFDGVYGYYPQNIEDFLPHVYEGENTFFRLTHEGYPMFHCDNSWEVKIDLTNNPDFYAWLINFYKHVCNDATSWYSPPEGDIVGWIADYFYAARDPQSNLTMYFKALKKYAELPTQDRYLLGLENAVDILESTIISESYATNKFSLTGKSSSTDESLLEERIDTSDALHVGVDNPIHDLLIVPAQKLKTLFSSYINSLFESNDLFLDDVKKAAGVTDCKIDVNEETNLINNVIKEGNIYDTRNNYSPTFFNFSNVNTSQPALTTPVPALKIGF